MKLSIFIPLIALATSVTADGPFMPGTNYFSRKAMRKWSDYLHEDKHFRKEYTKYIEEGFGARDCPSDMSETEIKLATATGQRIKKKSRGLFTVWDWNKEYAKYPSKLNVVEFVYHINHNDRVCAVAVVHTGLKGGILTSLDYYWQEPSLYMKPKARWNPFDGYIDIDNLKLSAGEALDQVKENNPNLKNGFLDLRLKATDKGPVYVFEGFFGNKDGAAYINAN